jgi:tetratricopeptide (TPR) repeat protein
VLEIGEDEAQGAQLANEGIKLLMDRKPTQALELLQKAYPLMKKHPDNFRVLGNIATAYAMLGNREDAMAMLRAALKANPDYDLARDNLHRLGILTPEEFRRLHKAGAFEKMNIINDKGRPVDVPPADDFHSA